MTTLDVSNYDADTFDVGCLKAAGVEGIILGCQREDIARTMAQKAADGGLPILGTYAFLYFGLDTTGQTMAAIRVAKDFGIGTVWLDCESTGTLEDGHQTHETRQRQLRDCVQLVEAHGLRAGIYTGSWWWPPYMANTAEFSRLPLWHAAYGPNSGPADPIRTVNYGGWSAVAVHQYTSTLNLCGRNRDANYVFEEADMADPRVDDILRALTGLRDDAALARLAAWNTADGGADSGNSLLDGYTLEQAKLAEHLDAHTQLQTVGLPDHEHEPGGVKR